ncbi:MAG: hypothetical protein Q8P22_14325 [Chloroflexota bacterium]|nr:hypothetical protein [Chloroflexota bacterium]
MAEVSLRDQVVLVHGLRTGLESIKASLKAKRAAFDAENADLLIGLLDRTTELARAETALRDAAMGAYVLMGARKPAPGVEVKDFTEIDYDKGKAFTWATFHEMALVLDTKAFEAIAKAAQPPLDFVTIAKVPKATIATDLGKALEATDGGK